MRPWPSAMAQDFIAGASCFVQRIGQFRHPLEGTVVVNRLCQMDHGGRQPDWIDVDLAKGLRAKNLPDQGCLRQKFGVLGAEQGITGNSGLGAASSISCS